MQIQQLKDNEPLKVEEVILHHEIAFKGNLIEKKVQTRIFTDGIIYNQDNQKYERINEYYIDGKKYNSEVDGIKTKNIYITNHNYVISCLIVNNNGFLQVKDMTVYLANPEDIDALKEAKWVIRNTIHYFKWSELHKTRFSLEEGLETYDGREVETNIYCLKKEKTNIKSMIQ